MLLDRHVRRCQEPSSKSRKAVAYEISVLAVRHPRVEDQPLPRDDVDEVNDTSPRQQLQDTLGGMEARLAEIDAHNRSARRRAEFDWYGQHGYSTHTRDFERRLTPENPVYHIVSTDTDDDELCAPLIGEVRDHSLGLTAQYVWLGERGWRTVGGSVGTLPAYAVVQLARESSKHAGLAKQRRVWNDQRDGALNSDDLNGTPRPSGD
jgi:hypothetical protein